jgi:hypothetical protein
MAAITTTKALNLARDLMNASDAFLAALEKLLASAAEQDGAGIDFKAADVEEGLAGAGDLQHMTGADLDAVIATSGAVKTWLHDNFHDAVYQKVRP